MQEQAIQHQVRDKWCKALVFLFIAAVVAFPHRSQAASGPSHHALTNGNFEHGFTALPGCASGSKDSERNVGTGWGCFTNYGAANYGFYADRWTPVVADGQYSQLIEINTWGIENGDNYRYAGIYQSVPTVAGAEYRLSMRGMIRTTNLDGDLWRYSVQVGYLEGGNTDWRYVKNWSEVGWNKYYPRTEPGTFSEYQTTLTPQSDQITLFIRVWKKWGLANEELDVNLDAIQLTKLDSPAPKN